MGPIYPFWRTQPVTPLTIAWKPSGYRSGIRLEASVLLPPRAARHRHNSSVGPVHSGPVQGRLPTRSSDPRAVATSWRKHQRLGQLQSLAASLEQLRWSHVLLQMLIEELHVDDEFNVLLGDPGGLPVRRYPQAVAVAMALRHSWRPDLLARVATRLRRMSRERRLRRPRIHKSHS